MEPLTLLAWAAVTALSLTIISITTLIIWTVIQTMRGKRVTKSGRP